MELRHLRYFVAVAESLHFGRAAIRLQIAQPSLSHQIRQLETELQTALLQRTKRRVRLTEAGRRFLEEAREVLAHADRAAMIARTASLGWSEPLRVGFAIWTDLTKVFRVIKRLNELDPTIRVDLRSMSVPLQIAALKDGFIDLGIMRALSPEPLLNSEMLVAEPFVVALPKDHRLARKKRIVLSALAKESFITAPREALPHFYDLTLKLCRDAGFVPRVRDEVDYPSVVLGLVATGIGISLVPASVRKIQSTGIVFRPLEPSPRILETSVAWRRDNTARNVNTFLELIRSTMTRKTRIAKSPRKAVSN